MLSASKTQINEFSQFANGRRIRLIAVPNQGRSDLARKGTIVKVTDIRDALSGKRILSVEERVSFQRTYEEASERSRREMVAAFLMQGVSSERMADFLDVPAEEVDAHFKVAKRQVQKELESIPEGPLLMSQIVIEGYSRYAKRVFREIDNRISEADDKDVAPLMKLGIEIMNQVADRMEKYGFVGKTAGIPGVSHGGSRTKKADSSGTFDSVLVEIAKEHDIDLQTLKNQTINESVSNGTG